MRQLMVRMSAEMGGFGEEVVAEGADVSRSDIFDEKMPAEGTNVSGKAGFGDDAPAVKCQCQQKREFW